MHLPLRAPPRREGARDHRVQRQKDREAERTCARCPSSQRAGEALPQGGGSFCTRETFHNRQRLKGALACIPVWPRPAIRNAPPAEPSAQASTPAPRRRADPASGPGRGLRHPLPHSGNGEGSAHRAAAHAGCGGAWPGWAGRRSDRPRSPGRLAPGRPHVAGVPTAPSAKKGPAGLRPARRRERPHDARWCRQSEEGRRETGGWKTKWLTVPSGGKMVVSPLCCDCQDSNVLSCRWGGGRRVPPSLRGWGPGASPPTSGRFGGVRLPLARRQHTSREREGPHSELSDGEAKGGPTASGASSHPRENRPAGPRALTQASPQGA